MGQGTRLGGVSDVVPSIQSGVQAGIYIGVRREMASARVGYLPLRQIRPGFVVVTKICVLDSNA